MATLSLSHWERVPPILREIIVWVGQGPFAQRFYLAGETALALQLGHRISVDLDFFSISDELLGESRREIVAALHERFPLEIIENTMGRLLLTVQGSRMHFFSYGYPLLVPTVMVEGVALAGLLDIGLMKMDAIVGRAARKDFYDLYFLTHDIPLEEMLAQGQRKYPHTRDFAMMVLAALVDFAYADQQAAIATFPPVDWESVKAFFVQEIQRIGRQWFERA
jgi:hypothetical protein